MARRGHADLGAFARDQAVHLLDLGAASLDHVLRHRGALDVGARVGAGLRDQHALDRGERFGIALAGSRELLRLYAADLLELEAERLADAHAFAGELDLEAADRRVVRARRGGESGGGGDAVAHAVLAELRPALAPQIARRLRAVDTAEPFRQLLDARRDAPVRLADAKDRVLVAALVHRAPDAAGLVKIHRNERGHHADDAPPADDAGDG